MIDASKLITGECYYNFRLLKINKNDDSANIINDVPLICAMIYLGKNLSFERLHHYKVFYITKYREDVDKYYFQETIEYYKHQIVTNVSEHAGSKVIGYDLEDIGKLFDLSGLIDKLLIMAKQ